MNEERESGVRRPDWTKLPVEVAYLKEPAKRYGDLMALGQPLRRRLKASEREELRELASQIGWQNHDLPIQSWLVQQSIAGHHYEVELVEGLLNLLEHLGFDYSDYGPKQDPQWTLHLWDTLHYRVLQDHVDDLRDILPEAQAYEVVVRTLERVPREDLGEVAFWMLHPFRTSSTLDWIESHETAIEADAHEVFSPMWHWGDLAAVSRLSWARAKSWIGRGRPLSLVALDALINMDGTSESPVVQEANPNLPEYVPFDEASRVLKGHANPDQAPWVERKVESILERWPAIIGHP